MRKTYAYNSIILGVLAGIGAWAASESVVLGILALLGVSVIGFIIIRGIEKLIGKGVDAAADAAAKAYQNHKNKKDGQQ